MAEDAENRKPRLAVSVQPRLAYDVEYLTRTTISLQIINLTEKLILVENITLQFQSDSGSVPRYVDSTCGTRVPGHELTVESVDVVPTLLFLENTNSFNVMVHYREESEGRLGDRVSELHRNVSYLIVRKPNTQIGDIFISFKQPENSSWARLIEQFAWRAGLRPYIALNNPEPGSEQWNRIEDAIRRSERILVIWGDRTDWGTGVQKEVELCRKHGVQEVLLLQHGLDLPREFKDTIHEYTRFDPYNPSEAFAIAVESVRQQLLR